MSTGVLPRFPALPMVVCIVLIVSGGAGAQADEPLGIGARNNQAVELSKRGEYQEAIAVWMGIIREVPEHHKYLWAFYLNIGRAYQKLESFPAAWWYFEKSLQLRPDQTDTRRWFESVADILAMGHVRVTLRGEEPGTQVRLTHGDIQEWYALPLTWWFEPGQQDLLAHAPDFPEQMISALVNQKDGDVVVKLRQPIRYGTLQLDSNQVAVSIIVDGEEVFPEHGRVVLPVGPHQVAAQASGHETWGGQATVVADEVTVLRIDMVPVAPALLPGTLDLATQTHTDPPGWPWYLAGASGLLALGGGALFATAVHNSRSQRDDLIADYGSGPMTSQQAQLMQADWNERLSQHVRPYQYGSYAMWGLAGIGTVACALLLWPHSTGEAIPAEGESRRSSRGPVEAVVPIPLSGGLVFHGILVF